MNMLLFVTVISRDILADKDSKTVLNKMSTFLSSSKKYIFDHIAIFNYPQTATKSLCCIGISPQEFFLVSAHTQAKNSSHSSSTRSEHAGNNITNNNVSKIMIKLCESFPYDNTSHLTSSLSNMVKDYHLKNMFCSLMLSSNDYQLLITDALPVPDAEFKAAVLWKIKDLLHYPIDDVVIGNFKIPKMSVGQSKIMVVAAQASHLKRLSNIIRDVGLNIKFIDIPEFGLRNIMALYEQAQKTTMFIYIKEQSVQFLITFNQQLYVTRQLNLNLNDNNTGSLQQTIEHLAHEIKRSIEYYQSQWREFANIPFQFILAATKAIGSNASDILAQRINAPIKNLDLNEVLYFSANLDRDQQGKYLPFIGGAIRESIKHATTD